MNLKLMANLLNGDTSCVDIPLIKSGIDKLLRHRYKLRSEESAHVTV